MESSGAIGVLWFEFCGEDVEGRRDDGKPMPRKLVATRRTANAEPPGAKNAALAIATIAIVLAAKPISNVARVPSRRPIAAPPSENATASSDCGTNSVPYSASVRPSPRALVSVVLTVGMTTSASPCTNAAVRTSSWRPDAGLLFRALLRRRLAKFDRVAFRIVRSEEEAAGSRHRHYAAIPRKTTIARLSCKSSLSESDPMREPSLVFEIVVTLSTIVYDISRSPLRASGSILSRASGESICIVVNGHTATESPEANRSSWTITAGRGLAASSQPPAIIQVSPR